MAKHTPGPWSIKYGTNVFGDRIDTGHPGCVATCGGHSSNQVDCGPENRANARLIAAAPDLLAAAVAVLAWADREAMPQGGKNDGPWEAIEAAIAKATVK
jgi:hypothetical protein